MNLTAAHVQDVARHATPEVPEYPGVRQAIHQLLGVTFFDTLLKIADDSVLKGAYGHGGRAEQAFRRQLDAVFSDRVASSGRFKLGDSIYRRVIQHPRYSKDAALNDDLLRNLSVIG